MEKGSSCVLSELYCVLDGNHSWKTGNSFEKMFLFLTKVNHTTLATLNCISHGMFQEIIYKKTLTREAPTIAVLPCFYVHCSFIVTEQERSLLPYVTAALV